MIGNLHKPKAGLFVQFAGAYQTFSFCGWSHTGYWIYHPYQFCWQSYKQFPSNLPTSLNFSDINCVLTDNDSRRCVCQHALPPPPHTQLGMPLRICMPEVQQFGQNGHVGPPSCTAFQTYVVLQSSQPAFCPRLLAVLWHLKLKS